MIITKSNILNFISKIFHFSRKLKTLFKNSNFTVKMFKCIFISHKNQSNQSLYIYKPFLREKWGVLRPNNF